MDAEVPTFLTRTPGGCIEITVDTETGDATSTGGVSEGGVSPNDPRAIVRHAISVGDHRTIRALFDPSQRMARKIARSQAGSHASRSRRGSRSSAGQSVASSISGSDDSDEESDEVDDDLAAYSPGMILDEYGPSLATTPLLFAIECGRAEMADMLLSFKGCDPHARLPDGSNATFAAVRHRDRLRPLQVLLESGRYNVEERLGGWTVLMYAAYLGRDLHVQQLCRAGANVDARMDGATALGIAAAEGHNKTCSVLIAAGADVNGRGFEGAPPLTHAATSGRLSTAQLLLSAGADPDFPDDNGRTPLFAAVESAQLEIVNLLVSRGANVRVRAACGCSMLDVCASRTGDVKVADCLLGAGAEPGRRVECAGGHVDRAVGHTTLTAAITAGNVKVGEDLLLARGTRNTPKTVNAPRMPHHWSL